MPRHKPKRSARGSQPRNKSKDPSIPVRIHALHPENEGGDEEGPRLGSVPLHEVGINPLLPVPTIDEICNIPTIQSWLYTRISPRPSTFLANLAALLAARIVVYQNFTYVEWDFMAQTDTAPEAYWFWTLAEVNPLRSAQVLLALATNEFFPYLHSSAYCEQQVCRHLKIFRTLHQQETEQLRARLAAIK